jgi:hypothetical protein
MPQLPHTLKHRDEQSFSYNHVLSNHQTRN